MSLVIAFVLAFALNLISAWLNARGYRTAAVCINAAAVCINFAVVAHYFGVLIAVLLVVGAAALGVCVGYYNYKTGYSEE